MNAVCPGTVETPSWHVSFYDDDEEEEEDSNYAGDGADADDFTDVYK